jgi:uncharacterized protein (DUF169 family)
MRSTAEFEAFPHPRPHTPLHYCSAVRAAAEGSLLKLRAEDISCDTAPKTLGMEDGFFDPAFIDTYVTAGLYEDATRAREALADVVTLDGVVGVALGPLESFGDESPDIVIVATTPYGGMRLNQAITFAGGRVRSESIGMHGLCSESTAAPAATGRVCTSLMCSGARHMSEWDEELLSAGIPYGLLPSIVEALLRTAERYENDDRKAEIRAGCAGTSSVGDRVGDELSGLAPGTAYFCSFPKHDE